MNCFISPNNSSVIDCSILTSSIPVGFTFQIHPNCNYFLSPEYCNSLLTLPLPSLYPFSKQQSSDHVPRHLRSLQKLPLTFTVKATSYRGRPPSPYFSAMSSNTLLATIHSSSHTGGFLDIPKNTRQSLLWPFHDLFFQVTQGSLPCLLHSFAQMSLCQETFSDSPFKNHTGAPALLIALPIFVFLHRTYHL